MHISESSYRKMTGKPPKAASPYRRYLPHKVDKNQASCVEIFRKNGFMVQLLHEHGDGVTDLAVARGGLTVFVEVKNGLLAPSAREYTPKQSRWHFAWAPACMRCVVICDEDCRRVIASVNALLELLNTYGIKLEVKGNQERQYLPKLY